MKVLVEDKKKEVGTMHRLGQSLERVVVSVEMVNELLTPTPPALKAAKSGNGVEANE